MDENKWKLRMALAWNDLINSRLLFMSTLGYSDIASTYNGKWTDELHNAYLLALDLAHSNMWVPSNGRAWVDVYGDDYKRSAQAMNAVNDAEKAYLQILGLYNNRNSFKENELQIRRAAIELPVSTTAVVTRVVAPMSLELIEEKKRQLQARAENGQQGIHRELVLDQYVERPGLISGEEYERKLNSVKQMTGILENFYAPFSPGMTSLYQVSPEFIEQNPEWAAQNVAFGVTSPMNPVFLSADLADAALAGHGLWQLGKGIDKGIRLVPLLFKGSIPRETLINIGKRAATTAGLIGLGAGTMAALELVYNNAMAKADEAEKDANALADDAANEKEKEEKIREALLYRAVGAGAALAGTLASMYWYRGRPGTGKLAGFRNFFNRGLTTRGPKGIFGWNRKPSTAKLQLGRRNENFNTIINEYLNVSKSGTSDADIKKFVDNMELRTGKKYTGGTESERLEAFKQDYSKVYNGVSDRLGDNKALANYFNNDDMARALSNNPYGSSAYTSKIVIPEYEPAWKGRLRNAGRLAIGTSVLGGGTMLLVENDKLGDLEEDKKEDQPKYHNTSKVLGAGLTLEELDSINAAEEKWHDSIGLTILKLTPIVYKLE